MFNNMKFPKSPVEVIVWRHGARQGFASMTLVRWSKGVFILTDKIGDEYQIRWDTGKSSLRQLCTVQKPELEKLIAVIAKCE